MALEPDAGAGPDSTVPADDAERVPLSGERTQLVSVVFPALWVAALIVAGLGLLRGGGVDAPLGIVLLVLSLLGALVAWRWATPLRRVVATRTGLIVSGLRTRCFIPYATVTSARESQLSRNRTITVTLREPVAGLRPSRSSPRIGHSSNSGTSTRSRWTSTAGSRVPGMTHRIPALARPRSGARRREPT